jgi:tetratricopeptide (TPR) repeat protein
MAKKRDNQKQNLIRQQKRARAFKVSGAALVAGVGLLAYANTFHSTFQFDDIAFIIRNYALRDVGDFQGITQAVLDQPSRAVGLYSFAVNYHFHQLNVVGYHVTNLLIHLASAFTVWWLAGLIMGLAPYRLRGRNTAGAADKASPRVPAAADEARWLGAPWVRKAVPLAAALLFVAHPAQTQAVTYISQRFASLATLFYLLSAACYIKARLAFEQGFGPLEKGQAKASARERRSGQDRRRNANDRRKGQDRRQKEISIPHADRRQQAERRKLDDRRSHTRRRKKAQDKKWDRIEAREQKARKQKARSERKVLKKQRRSARKSQKIDEGNPENANRDRRGWRVWARAWAWGLGFVLCAVLGLFTKEVVITLPVMVLAIEGWFFAGRSTGSPLRSRAKRRWILLVALGVLLACLASVVPALFGFNVSHVLFTPKVSASHAGDLLTFPRYLMTQARVFVTFLRLFVLPVGQNFDYDFPMSRSLAEAATSGSVLVAALLIAGIARWFRRRPVLSFGMAWVLITFSANLVPRRNVIFEHKMYLLSFGFCLVLSYLLARGLKDARRFALVVGLVVAVLGILTFQRNQVWQNGITLWEDVVKKSPDKIRGHHNLGTYYRKAGRYEEALDSFNRALALEPAYQKSLNTRAGLYRKMGLPQKALKEFDRALDLDPTLAELHNNKGNVYKSLGQWPRALASYNQAIELNPKYATAYYNRGLIYERLGQRAAALKDYNRVIELDPEFARAYNNRGRLRCLKRRYDAGLADFEKALTFNPELVEAYYNKARTYEALNQFDLAFENYQKALELKPDHAAAYFNMGNISAEMGRFALAVDLFEKALAVDPGHYGAKQNLERARQFLPKTIKKEEK